MSAKLTEAPAPFKIYRSWFGDHLKFSMPAGCDMILVCADTVQHTPIWVGLPHHLTVKEARRLLDEHATDSLHVMPYRNSDKIQIGRAALEQEGTP